MHSRTLALVVIAPLLVVGVGATTLIGACARKKIVEPAGQQSMRFITGDTLMRCPAALVAAREGGTDADRFVVPEPDERATIRELVAGILALPPAPRSDLDRMAALVGYDLIETAEIPGTLLLRERRAQRRGGGAFLFRTDSRAPLVLQAPHTFFDEGTLPLSCELFQRTSARALFIDTAHRYRSAQQTENGEHPADVAHSPATLFQAATEGMLRSIPKAVVVQIHGFAVRESGGAVVLSTGEKRPGDSLLTRVQNALASVVPGKVLRFPEDGGELGATTNVQGAVVRAAGGRFVHIELEARLRRDLLANPQLRSGVLGALASVLEDA